MAAIHLFLVILAKLKYKYTIKLFFPSNYLLSLPLLSHHLHGVYAFCIRPPDGDPISSSKSAQSNEYYEPTLPTTSFIQEETRNEFLSNNWPWAKRCPLCPVDTWPEAAKNTAKGNRDRGIPNAAFYWVFWLSNLLRLSHLPDKWSQKIKLEGTVTGYSVCLLPGFSWVLLRCFLKWKSFFKFPKESVQVQQEETTCKNINAQACIYVVQCTTIMFWLAFTVTKQGG